MDQLAELTDEARTLALSGVLGRYFPSLYYQTPGEMFSAFYAASVYSATGPKSVPAPSFSTP